MDDNGLYTSSAGTGDGGVIVGREKLEHFRFGEILCCVFGLQSLRKPLTRFLSKLLSCEFLTENLLDR
ncbi:MAG: hypothetical protein CM15mP49_25260 [Actinomycetota bacterium]|nr:MAG: hypothetical protein CM15mP49_25260 [Actinomycetota bacterium]